MFCQDLAFKRTGRRGQAPLSSGCTSLAVWHVAGVRLSARYNFVTFIKGISGGCEPEELTDAEVGEIIKEVS